MNITEYDLFDVDEGRQCTNPLVKQQVIEPDYEALLAEPPDGMCNFVEVRIRSIFTVMHQSSGDFVHQLTIFNAL